MTPSFPTVADGVLGDTQRESQISGPRPQGGGVGEGHLRKEHRHYSRGRAAREHVVVSSGLTHVEVLSIVG